MSEIQVRKKRSFSAIPDDVLEDTRLSLRARAVLGWMLGRPENWTFFVGYMQKKLGMSEAVWAGVRSELERVGYYKQERVRGELGLFVWVREVFDTPSPEDPGMVKAIPGSAMDGAAIHGPGGDITVCIEAPGSKQQQHAEPDAAASLTPSTPTPKPRATGKRTGTGKRRQVRESGIMTWYAEDVSDAETLEGAHAPEVIAAAVAALAAEGKQPVPGLVQQKIEDLAAAQAAAAEHAERLRRSAEQVQVNQASGDRGGRATREGYQAARAKIQEMKIGVMK